MMRTKQILALIFSFALLACTTNQVDLAAYTPVIDVARYDRVKYIMDLDDCRTIGKTVQAEYQKRRAEEVNAAILAGLLGAVAGAAVGSQHNRDAAAAGAIYGAAIGGAIGADGIDYSRVIAKMGPGGVVDECMRGRGYTILSVKGYGGG